MFSKRELIKKMMIPGLPAAVLFSFLSGSIYDFSVPKIEGGSQALSAYAGKKILVITLPVVQNASADSMLYSLDTLATAHAASLKVVAVPSYEDGFTAAQKTQLKLWYRSKLGTGILITDGLYTRKTSGTQQHALFKWLTDDNQNDMFNIDVEGPGHKFFTKGNGSLYGELTPQIKIWSAAVQRTLNMQ